MALHKGQQQTPTQSGLESVMQEQLTGEDDALCRLLLAFPEASCGIGRKYNVILELILTNPTRVACVGDDQCA